MKEEISDEFITRAQAQKWANALRSGKYSQSKHHLEDSGGFCCLGVACKLFIPKKLQNIDDVGTLVGSLPEDHQHHAPEWLAKINEDLSERMNNSEVEPLAEGEEYEGDTEVHTFADMNDIGLFNFQEIADIIELVYVHKALD